MNDLEFLDHCEQLCARPDAWGKVEFPRDVHQRFNELLAHLTHFQAARRLTVSIRLESIALLRRHMALAVLARLRK